jgi:transcriptional regulator with XRE-family HTH domain
VYRQCIVTAGLRAYGRGMNNRDQVRDFLISRRGRITPEQAGLPAGTRRRVPGLRRSEVAALADMSVEYYGKLERGNIAGVSPAVLDAVARALRLDDVERAHLLHLAQAAEGSDTLARPRKRSSQRALPHSLRWSLEAITGGPAYVCNGRLDILAANALSRAFFVDLIPVGGEPPNCARYTFLDPSARRFYRDWDLIADLTVDALRVEAGRNPYDRDLHDLVGQLCTLSDEFRERWGAHNVGRFGTGVKRFHHPTAGDVTLAYDSLRTDADPGLILTVYTPEPGSPSAERLALLASWSATAPTQPTTTL